MTYYENLVMLRENDPQSYEAYRSQWNKIIEENMKLKNKEIIAHQKRMKELEAQLDAELNSLELNFGLSDESEG